MDTLEARGPAGRKMFEAAAEIYGLPKTSSVRAVISAIETDPAPLIASKKVTREVRYRLRHYERTKQMKRMRWVLKENLDDDEYEAFKRQQKLFRQSNQAEAADMHIKETLSAVQQRKALIEKERSKLEPEPMMRQVANEASTSGTAAGLSSQTAELLDHWRSIAPAGTSNVPPLAVPDGLVASGPGNQALPSTSTSVIGPIASFTAPPTGEVSLETHHLPGRLTARLSVSLGPICHSQAALPDPFHVAARGQSYSRRRARCPSLACIHPHCYTLLYGYSVPLTAPR